MSYDICPRPVDLGRHGDRHIASHEDDYASGEFVNDAGDVYYLPKILLICQGCGTELNEHASMRNSSGRWQSAIWLIEEEPI